MTVFNVSSASELQDALNKATGGDEIRLAGGDYGELELQGTDFKSTVTIVSADPSDMAQFSALSVQGSSYIAFEKIVFDYEYEPGDRTAATNFEIVESSNISISDSVFDGDVAYGTGTSADGAGTGRGLRIRESSDIVISDTEFHSWWKAVNINTSQDVDFIGNDIHSIRSDGINVGSSQRILIEDNYIHDFGAAEGSSDHRDMIQIKRSNGVGSEDIVIRNNVFDMGEGDYAQTIFAGSDSAVESDPDGWHTDIIVEGNIIYNAHTHGITFSLTDGLEITNNTILAVPRDKDGGITIPTIKVTTESKDVTVEKNVVAGFNGYEGQTDWSVKNNVFVQNTDPSAPFYYDDHFIYYATADEDGYNQFGVKPGSLIEELGAGSPLVNLYPTSDGGTPSGDGVSSETGEDGDTVSDGGSDDDDLVEDNSSQTDDQSDTGEESSDTQDPVDNNSDDSDEGSVDQPDSDGTSSETPTTGQSGEDEANAFLELFDDYVLDIAATLEDSEQVFKAKDDAHVEFDGSDYCIVFDGDKDAVRLGQIEEFEDSAHIAFSVGFARAEADGSEQRVIWNHQKLGLSVVDDGLIAMVGGKHFVVDDLGLNDTEQHQISVIVDQDSDRLQVLVDDLLVLDADDQDLDFVGRGGHEWGWKIGTPWSREVNGTVTDFRIDDDIAFVEDAVFADSSMIG